MRSAQAISVQAPPDAVVAAVQASSSANSSSDAELLALRVEWLDRQAEHHAALDVIEFASTRRFAATAEQKLAADRLADSTLAALDDVVERALAIPARTSLGLAFKIEMAQEFGNDQVEINRAIFGDLLATGHSLQTAASTPAADDPIFAQIELHKALRVIANSVPGDAGDHAYDAAQDAEEAAIQALGDMLPSTIAAAAAQLAYMAEVEGDFADKISPLLRTVLTVARALNARFVA